MEGGSSGRSVSRRRNRFNTVFIWMVNMLVNRQNRQTAKPQRVRTAADLNRRQRVAMPVVAAISKDVGHPFCDNAENTRLYQYESRVKESFDKIETVLRQVAQYQHEVFFAAQAQEIALQQLGFNLPEALLENTWVKPLDMGALYAACVFETFRRFADEFYQQSPLSLIGEKQFQVFIEECGFHTLDISPCADGRLAHLVRYVLRLPHKAVRRKSYAGAMFDVEDNIQKWVETELVRNREGSDTKNSSYLKVAVYHYSSSLPNTEGCAAHGSDVNKAAAGALSRLVDFKQGVENSFCCGAQIDLLLIGIDTDNDSIRIHVPDGRRGGIDTTVYIDAKQVYQQTQNGSGQAEVVIGDYVAQWLSQNSLSVNAGMKKFVSRLLLNNLSQIDYVREHYKGCYSDIGHQERFIGMGLGFEEVQLRNLTYFAYLKTVELGAKDVDVGLKIFTGLNLKRGLPAPIVIRYDYHGQVPGARERAVNRCAVLDQALRSRFPTQAKTGLIHTLQVIRDVNGHGSIDIVANSAVPVETAGGH